jgi:hypothetical protein
MKFSAFTSYLKKLNFGHLLLVGVLMSILIPFCNNSLGEVDALFMDLDKSQSKQMVAIDSTNQGLFWAIEESAEAYKNPINLSYLNESDKIRRFSSDFYKKIDSLRSELIAQSGGLDAYERPVFYKDKNISFAYFSQNQRAEWLNQEMSNTIDSLLACIRNPRDRAVLERNVTFVISDLYDNYLKEKFKNHSVASVLSILNLVKNNAKVNEAALLNYVAQKVGGSGMCCFCDVPRIQIAPNQGYGIIGDKFQADITLRTYGSNQTKINIVINGKAIKTNDGVGRFSQRETILGPKKMSVSAVVFSKRKIGRYQYIIDTAYLHKDFFYEVGVPMAFLQTKINQNLYVGVAHQISVHVAECDDENIKLSSNDLIINKIENGKYIIQADKTGKVKLRVDGKTFGQTFYFDVKNIPRPLAILDQQNNENTMTKEKWALQKSLIAEVKDFDFETDCKVESFVFTYIPQREDAVEITNSSANFNAQIIDIQKITKPKDVIHFTEIKAKCQGDTEARLLNTMVFEIR